MDDYDYYNDQPYTDDEMYKLMDKANEIRAKRINECPYRYESINPKSGTLDIFYYCKLRKNKLCPNIDCICWYAKEKE